MDFKFVVIFSFVLKVIHGLYISQQNLSFCFPNNAEQGMLLGRVFVHTKISSDCSEADIEYALMATEGTKNVLQYFEITGSGWIRLASPLDGTAKGQTLFNFLIEVKCKSESSLQPLIVPVTLRQETSSMAGSIQKDDMRRHCFGDLPKTFQIEENVENVSLGLLRGCGDETFNISTEEITMMITINSVVIDLDEAQAAPHTVEILNDPFGVCRAKEPICYQVNNSQLCRLGASLDLRRPNNTRFRCRTYNGRIVK
ncbi:hypothetical protein ACJMK2_035276 [Sinanodonta woodiana]|uniref:Cadherin domain-containing protein n=1 Tax=Sinanodonta woodiana TaxID=1069815 RepID=A0ABD3WUD5_SINWO